MVGRAGNESRSPYPSRVMAVNPAGVRGRLMDLPQEIWVVSLGTGAIEKSPDLGSEVSRGRIRPDYRLKARTVPVRG
jgi:hypothetical protein